MFQDAALPCSEINGMPVKQRKSLFLTVRGQQIYVEIDGQGPYMIMTHGLGSSSNLFQPLTELFSSRYTVLRIDWPGSGHSGLTRGHPPLSVPGFTADLMGVMNCLNIKSATLVGHSLGGMISMQVAAQAPHRVDGLVVIGAGRSRAVEGPSRDSTLALAKLTREIGVAARVDQAVEINIPRTSPALARALLRQVTSMTNPEGYAQTCDALTDPSHVDPDYSAITCPTCVVGSEFDNIASVEVTEELHRLIGRSGNRPHLRILQTGHMQIIEDVEGVTAAIETVLVKGPR